MAKDDSLKKPKKIEVNRIMIFISSILIPFLWIDLYLVLKNASKMMVVGIIAALILVWTGLLVTYIHRMKNEEKAHSDEQVEELLRTGKANYLMQKKLAEKIDNIGEKDAVPADEIITAQKAIAKLMLARNKENTDALMHSNEQVIEKTLEVEEKLSENSQQIMDMQKNQMDEKLQELMQSQKLVLDNLNDVKESLQSDMQDVLSNMIHDTLEKELASAIEQIHTYVKEAASQAVDSVKENLAAEVPVMAAVSPAMDEELPDPGMRLERWHPGENFQELCSFAFTRSPRSSCVCILSVSFCLRASSSSIRLTKSLFFMEEIFFSPRAFARSRKTTNDKLSYFSLIHKLLTFFTCWNRLRK